MRRLWLLVVLVAAAALALPAAVLAHPERSTQFPDPSEGSVPSARNSGPSHVVCKADSRRRIERQFGVRAQRRRAIAFTGRRATQAQAKLRRMGETRLRVLKRCRFRHIQAAVNAARSGDRILVMPGVYKEEPSRRVPFTGPPEDRQAPEEGGGRGNGLDALGSPSALTPGTITGFFSKQVLAVAARAAGDVNCRSTESFEQPEDGDPPVPTYEFQYECPNSRNLIAVLGDSNDDGRCDSKCNLQIQGMGRRPTDVLIVNDRIKRDVIRGDRADGLIIKNLAAEQAAFNAIDIVETNGFRVEKLVTRWNQLYGILTFTTDHGLYQDIDAFGNGDSGVYPGSGPEGHCERYGIEITRVNSHDNVLGYSGTAGNGINAHHNNFSDNNTGMATDSFASGHPGMPQDCAKWTNNTIASNNRNFFTDERQDFCARTRFEDRPRKIVCPQFQVPVGSGLIMYGANENLIKNNFIYDNWRSGTRLFYVPAAVRGEDDPAKQFDTSHGNRHETNRMGVRADGTRDPNGIDFYWDEQGERNCWTGNTGPGGSKPSSDPPILPDCPGLPVPTPPNPAKSAQEAPCATWDPADNQHPPGCTWFDTPPEPK